VKFNDAIASFAPYITHHIGDPFMTSTAISRPIVATSIGDPGGIGPEIVAKAWVSGEAHAVSRPVLIGSAHAMRQGVEIARARATVRVISDVGQLGDSPEVIDIIDSGELDPAAIKLGQDSEACGHANAAWLRMAERMARSGEVAATVIAPVSSGSLKMARKLDVIRPVTPGESYLLLLSGPLRVLHLTGDMSLRRVCEVVSEDLTLSALQILDATFRAWGAPNPRIGVAGLNPHAMGEEDARAIAPAVARAQAQGIDAKGPLSPDAVFRHCIEGKYDVVLAMYHDQGHIPIKTWGFSGNCAVIVGPPYLNMTVGHGTAHDIAGKGIADHRMILNAMRMAGSLAAGAGFIKQ